MPLFIMMLLCMEEYMEFKIVSFGQDYAMENAVNVPIAEVNLICGGNTNNCSGGNCAAGCGK